MKAGGMRFTSSTRCGGVKRLPEWSVAKPNFAGHPRDSRILGAVEPDQGSFFIWELNDYGTVARKNLF